MADLKQDFKTSTLEGSQDYNDWYLQIMFKGLGNLSTQSPWLVKDSFIQEHLCWRTSCLEKGGQFDIILCMNGMRLYSACEVSPHSGTRIAKTLYTCTVLHAVVQTHVVPAMCTTDFR